MRAWVRFRSRRNLLTRGPAKTFFSGAIISILFVGDSGSTVFYRIYIRNSFSALSCELLYFNNFKDLGIVWTFDCRGCMTPPVSASNIAGTIEHEPDGIQRQPERHQGP